MVEQLAYNRPMDVQFFPGELNILKIVTTYYSYFVRYQTTKYSCGPASIANALKCLGKKVQEKNIIKLSNTTKKLGTDEHGIIKAITELGYNNNSFTTTNNNIAWNWIKKELYNGNPVILCVYNWSHWITAIGIMGDLIILIDPARTKRNKKENGILTLNKRDLIKTWKNKQSKNFYAIQIES